MENLNPAVLTKEEQERQAVIAEAITWLKTPFLHQARVKGAGCDCGRFLIAVYAKLGLMEDYEPPQVPETWHLHSDAPNFDPDMYVRQIQKFSREFEGPPAPGDIAMFWWGKAYSHSAIVINWPNEMIHCFFIAGVQFVDPQIDPYLKKYLGTHPPRYFTVWDPPLSSPYVPIPETAL